MLSIVWHSTSRSSIYNKKHISYSNTASTVPQHYSQSASPLYPINHNRCSKKISGSPFVELRMEANMRYSAAALITSLHLLSKYTVNNISMCNKIDKDAEPTTMSKCLNISSSRKVKVMRLLSGKTPSGTFGWQLSLHHSLTSSFGKSCLVW